MAHIITGQAAIEYAAANKGVSLNKYADDSGASREWLEADEAAEISESAPDSIWCVSGAYTSDEMESLYPLDWSRFSQEEADLYSSNSEAWAARFATEWKRIHGRSIDGSV